MVLPSAAAAAVDRIPEMTGVEQKSKEIPRTTAMSGLEQWNFSRKEIAPGEYFEKRVFTNPARSLKSETNGATRFLLPQQCGMMHETLALTKHGRYSSQGGERRWV